MAKQSSRGRPEIISHDLIQEICYRVGQGNTLSRVCRDDDMPARWTVTRWLSQGDKDLRNGVESLYADLSVSHARAREAQYEVNFEQIIDIADDVPEGAWLEDAEGNKYTADEYRALCKKLEEEGEPAPDVSVKGLTHELIAKKRLQIDARKFAVVKAMPYKYGDKIDMTLGGDIKRPLAVDHKKLVQALGRDKAKELLATLKGAMTKKGDE